MAGSRRKTTRERSKKVSSSIGPREVTAGEVIENLWCLFGHLGIDISRPIISELRTRGLTSAAHTLYPHASAIGELLTCWHQEPDYLDDQGNPALIKSHGPRPSFHSLARRTVPSIDESYLLSELERLGVVTIDSNKFLHVKTRSFPIYEDKRFAAQHSLRALNDFIRTLNHNIVAAGSNSEQLFHRVAWHGNFDAREAAALKARMKRQGQSFLEAFDSWLRARSAVKSKKISSKSTNDSAEVSIGVYLLVQKP